MVANMSFADEVSSASAHETLTHPEASPQPETTTYSQTNLPQLEASTIPISRLETAPPDNKSETLSIPELEPSSQPLDISSQYVIAPEELEHLRAIDAVTQLQMFRFDDVSIREACFFSPEHHKNLICLPPLRIAF